MHIHQTLQLASTPVLVRHLLRPSRLVWAYDWQFLDSQLLQTVLLESITCLWLPTHPYCPPHPSHLTAQYYSGCEKSCSKSCSVSQLLLMVMKHQPKHCSSYTANPAWLQSSMREPWQLQYFKLVFLEMSIVTLWSVSQIQSHLMCVKTSRTYD